MKPIRNDVHTIVTNLGEIGFKEKTILVAGGAGFLGSWLCDVLVEQNAKVICLDNLASGLKTNVSHLLQKENFRFIQHDVTQPIDLDERIDIIIHLASRASRFEFERFPIEILQANTLGTWLMLETARQHKARFLYASSSEIYGDPSLIPTPETYNGSVSSIGPRSCYDEAKRCGEAYAIAYRVQYGLDIRIARIFNTYGPRMRADGVYGRVVPRFVEQALKGLPMKVFGRGEQTRSFCYVADQIEGLLRLAFLEEARGEVINVGNDSETKIIDLARIVKGLANSDAEIVFRPLPEDDPVRRCPDITKAKRILNWEPRVGLKEGLIRTINYELIAKPSS